jgi:uncharacterized membrane protein HdeD (DUF308 family)
LVGRTPPGSFIEREPIMTNTSMDSAAAEPRKAGLWFIVEGVLLILLGVLAAALPAFAGLAAALTFGWVLVLCGILGFVGLIASRGHLHPVWSVVSALVAVIAGALVIWAPLAGVLSLALLIAAYLLVDAFASIALAFDQRRRAARGWGWMILSGLISLVLAGFIVFLRPVGDAVLVGFVVAIDLIIGGIALAGLGFAVRR